MSELKNEADRLKKLIPALRVYEVVVKNLCDGQNGFFAKGMKRFKLRLRKHILDDR